jgi:hypothetical protein
VRAPLSGWTGDFFGLAAESDTKLFAFGVNGGDSPGPAHVKVTRAHVSPGPPAP